jgi:hypothetical protein
MVDGEDGEIQHDAMQSSLLEPRGRRLGMGLSGDIHQPRAGEIYGA